MFKSIDARNNRVTKAYVHDAVGWQVRTTAAARVAVVTTWGGGLAGVRRDLLPWMQIMTELGVERFYVRILVILLPALCGTGILSLLTHWRHVVI